MPQDLTTKPFIHPNAICETEHVGPGSRIWAFAHVLPGARIGRDCNICDGVFIENDVVVGNEVTVKPGVQLWDGVRLEDGVFIGPNATFTNDRFPRSRQVRSEFTRISVERGASIGANATILTGIRIGAGAMVGAGAVVTRDVPAGAIVSGNPAGIIGYASTAKSSPAGDSGAELGPQAGSRLNLRTEGAFLMRMRYFGDLRGEITVAEFDDDLPFKPRRVFFVYEVPTGRVRGEQAHREGQHLLVALHGSVSVTIDDATQRVDVTLSDPTVGLYVPSGMWVTQEHYSRDAVVAVFASQPYDAADYIRSREEFLAVKAKATRVTGADQR